MQEIEILVECYSSKDQVFDSLSSFFYHGAKKVKDIYYYDPLRWFLKPWKNNKLEASFRLRNKEWKYFITYKRDYSDEQGIWVYSDEYETEVSDIETIQQILDTLWFKELVVVDNLKYVFTNQNYEIVLEEVEDLWLFIEIELLNRDVAEKDIKKQKDIMKQYLESLWLQISDELHSGKPELLLKKRKKHSYF